VTSVARDDATAHLVDYDVRGKDLTLLGTSTYAAHLTGQSDLREALRGPLVKWVSPVEALGREYARAEAGHWQKDCLQIAGTQTPARLRSGGRGQVTITSVTARGGTLKGPVALTMTANAAVSPASAAWAGTPISLGYTAPAGRAWEGEGVDVRAVSRMGVGTASFGFGHEKSPAVVRITSRITSRITRDLSPHGSATYNLTSVVPLQLGPGDGPPHAFGSAPLTWNAPRPRRRHGAPADRAGAVLLGRAPGRHGVASIPFARAETVTWIASGSRTQAIRSSARRRSSMNWNARAWSPDA
jgi:hypothetical protein